MSYVEKAEGQDFNDLLDEEEFQTDLKQFFSGGRYNYTPEQLEDTAQLAEDFTQHMRWQSTNEATAIFDLLYVQKSDKVVAPVVCKLLGTTHLPLLHPRLRL